MSGGLRIIVCGGRWYSDWASVCRILGVIHAQHNIVRLAHGDACGADRLADRWARQEGVIVQPYPAEWHLYPAVAGTMRNCRMLRCEQPDAVVAFPGGKGTAHMVKIARANSQVRRVWCSRDYEWAQILRGNAPL